MYSFSAGTLTVSWLDNGVSARSVRKQPSQRATIPSLSEHCWPCCGKMGAMGASRFLLAPNHDTRQSLPMAVRAR
ncbi:hypothetical protein GQ53DRAFT_438651 [Thozetella sp. PMI_491]|nr:hypothetical protein GQ53DRAFT_438651 [Thozetella sp. PMI_491]